MNRSQKKLAIIVIVLALLKIGFHYSENGFFEFILFNLLLKYLLLAIPLILLLVRATQKRLTHNFIINLVIIGIGYSIIYLLLSPTNLDRFDWKINFTKRQNIVALAKQDRLQRQENLAGSIFLIPDSLSLFIGKSNQVLVEKEKDSSITISFFIDRGLLDHYSAFVYTDNPTTISQLEAETKSPEHNEKKLCENWYFVSR